MNEEALLEAFVSAFRDVDADGRIQSSPAWHDLSPEGREQAAREAERQRTLEAALHPQGLSSTSKAVLARLTSG